MRDGLSIGSTYHQPIFLKGGERACILIHGFTGCTYEMLGLGEFLNARGYTVSIVSLKGHGTKPEDLLSVKAEDWMNDVINGYRKLSLKYERIYPVGLSMGALLAIVLANMFQEIRASVLLSPAIILKGLNRLFFPFLRYLPVDYYYTKPNGSNILDEKAKKHHIAYDRMPLKSIYEFYRLQRIAKRALTSTKCPFLVIYSTKDGTVSERSISYIRRKIKNRLSEIKFENSGHVLTVDRERDRVFNEVLGFINKN